jgi:hypothetical protein
MGCERAMEAQALSDYLLALRALLDATTAAGQASMAPRLAALCAEEGARHDVQHRLEAALALERFVMGGATGVRLDPESPRELVDEAEDHLRALLRDVLCGYLDADLKGVADDILLESGSEPFMDSDTQESEPREFEARDLRKEPRFEREKTEPEPYLDFDPETEYEPDPDYEAAPDYEAEVDSEPDTAELEAVTVAPEPVTVAPEPVTVAPEPVQHELDGVTHSADWGWDDPEDFSAPV